MLAKHLLLKDIHSHLGLRVAISCVLCLLSFGAAAQWVWTPQTGRFVNVKRMPKETPELQVEFARTLMLDGQYSEALKETGKFADFYGASPEADENQFLRGQIKERQEDYVDAAQEYQQVILNYPETDRYNEVIRNQYAIGDALFESGQDNLERQTNRTRFTRLFHPFQKRPFRKSIDVYNMVKGNQPFSEEAAEAQYKIGLCYYTLDEYLEAALEYRIVLERYNDSEWALEATYGLTQCYESSSLDPEYDQAPSRLAMDAIDEFTDRFPTDDRVEELTQVKREMFERIAEQRYQTGYFYERRRMFKGARISYEALVEQYQGTQAAEKAQAWLDIHPAPASGLDAYLSKDSTGP